MTVRPRANELFLSIAEGEDAFGDDAEFKGMKASGELRIFNPFELRAFEPQNAARVIRFFVGQAHRELRAQFPSLIREFCEIFLDRCALNLRITGFHALPPATQTAFRTALQSIHIIKSFTIEHDRRA
jgi:hypothetical protein